VARVAAARDDRDHVAGGVADGVADVGGGTVGEFESRFAGVGGVVRDRQVTVEAAAAEVVVGGVGVAVVVAHDQLEGVGAAVARLEAHSTSASGS